MSCIGRYLRRGILLVLLFLMLPSCDMASGPGSGEKDQASGEKLYRKWWRLVPFVDGTGRWGYRTKGRGRVIIPPRFEYAAPFFKDYAGVEIDGRNAYIDLTGAVVCYPEYPLSEGLHCVKSCSRLSLLGGNPKFGYKGRAGRYVIQPVYDNAYDFSQGLAAVRLNDKYGYIDKKSRMVIPPQFTWAGAFSEDRAAVLLNGKEGYIDKSGRVVIEPEFRWAGIFSDGLAAVLVGKEWGYINKAGEMIIKPRFMKAWPFYLGVARVEAAGKQLYINPRGEPILPGKSISDIARLKDMIKPGTFPYTFDPASFQNSDTTRGYHPQRGLIFPARGTALSPTVCIPVGTYSLRFSAKGPPGLEIERRIDLLLVPADGDEPQWPHLAGGGMNISDKWKEYQLGPVELSEGCYKVWLGLNHDLWRYGEDGTRYYDKNDFAEVKDITLEQLK